MCQDISNPYGEILENVGEKGISVALGVLKDPGLESAQVEVTD